MTDFLQNLAINLFSALLFGLLVSIVFQLVHARAKRKDPSFADRVAKLAENLKRSSEEVDSILEEIAVVMTDRQAAAAKLDKELERLSRHESQLKEQIDVLKDVPIPVAEHFAKLTERGERRSAKRDYLLFGAGVLTSIVSAVVLKWLGLA
jgi:cell division protein FtsB